MNDKFEYKMGDKVKALKTLREGPTGELPAQHFCNAGDVLIVRDTGKTFPVYVSHEGILDRSFGVHLDEICLS